jgi:hypothetical protein
VFLTETKVVPTLIISTSTTTWPRKVSNTEYVSSYVGLNDSVFEIFVGHVVVEKEMIKVGTSSVRDKNTTFGPPQHKE